MEENMSSEEKADRRHPSEQLHEKREQALLGGGQSRIDRQHEKGKKDETS